VTLRVKLACLLALLPAALGVGEALSSGSAFGVEGVTVHGLSANASPELTRQLVAAARSQSTTGFSAAAVLRSVARWTLVTDVHAQPQVPHGVTLTITERAPAARVEAGHRQIAVDASGIVITGLARLPRHLPGVRATRSPSGPRSTDPFVELALRVLGAAPATLRRRAVAVTMAAGGLTIHLHRGPRLIFGDGSLPHAKWDAAAAVLADPGSRGATYVDVRLPSRPTAQVADPATTSAGLASTGGNADPTATATIATASVGGSDGASGSTSG
jgi:cell division protein FtsQ